VAVDDEGVLWIAVSISGIGVNTDKIVKYDPNGIEGVVEVASGPPLGQPGDVVFVSDGPFEGALFVPDNTNLIQVDRNDGALTIVDTGGSLIGGFDAAVDEEMNVLTGGRFNPYNLVRHTLISDGGTIPESVEQRVLSKGGSISTMAGLDVMRIPEPGAPIAGWAALVSLVVLARLRTRAAKP
jgi:hypothetical protein